MTAHATGRAGARWVVGVVALTLLVHALVLLISPEVLRGELPDTDDYARLLRVRTLLEGGGWWDDLVLRGNAPYGERLHWTRPHDVVIAALALPLLPWLGVARAVHVAGVAVSPLLHVLAVVAAAWAARPLVRRPLGALAALALLAQPIVLAFAVPGRADHHMHQLLLFLLGTGWLLRACAAASAQPAADAATAAATASRAALWCGLVCAFGTWVSIELLVLPLFALVALALLWILRGGAALAAGRTLACAWAAGLVLALAIERPPSDWTVLDTDRLSAAHLAAAAIAAAGFAFAAALRPAATAGLRLLLALVLAAAGLALLRRLVPELLAGPMSATDDIVWSRWLDWIGEYRPLLVPRDLAGLGRFLLTLGPALLCLPFAFARLLHLWRDNGRDPSAGAWLALTLGLLGFVSLALYMVRFAGYAELLLALALACLAQSVADRLERLQPRTLRLAVRPLVLALLIPGFLFLGAAVQSAAQTEDGTGAPAAGGREAGRADVGPETATLAGLATMLADPGGLGDRSRVVLAFAQYGPELLYRTPHAALASPYHRNAAGLRAVHTVFTARDDAEALAVIRERGVELLLICPAGPERIVHGITEGDGSLHDRLVRGELPAWLEPLPLPEEQARTFRLLAVRAPPSR